MHILSKLIVKWLITFSETDYPYEDIEIFIYGVECTLNEVITDSIIILWSIYAHTFLETIIWLILFSVFRHQTGGLHSKSNLRCFLYTISLGIIVSYYCQLHIPFPEELLIYIFSITIVLLLAPRETSKIVLSNIETKRKKIFSALIVIITFLISIFCPQNLKMTLNYSIFANCILLLVDFLVKDKMHLLN